MSEDILHRLRAVNQNPDIQFIPNVYNETMILIEDICLANFNKALMQLGMLAMNRPANDLFDRDLQRETHFDSNELRTLFRQIFHSWFQNNEFRMILLCVQSQNKAVDMH
ncbi:hypothetical protein EVAR_75885_1 [Eumeta japonica]|uniref:Uncharacterized protein n=1 Tax=Eumeta variegata TaxID=151549 RepID=A0A4C1UY11_EUMVA|nr:hypothetical protein EVAR_75885_1 [Eumeta japonica]